MQNIVDKFLRPFLHQQCLKCVKKFSSRYFMECSFAGHLMEVKNHINNRLATAKRWPWPLNRGIKYSSLLTNKLGLWKVAA